MLKTLSAMGLLVLSLVVWVSFAGSNANIVRSTISGKPTHYKFALKADPPGMAADKAQNNLSALTNAALVKERSSAGGSFNAPGIQNGTANTIPYFNSWFLTGSRNSVYSYSMVGHSPKAGGTTQILTRVIPLEVQLIGADGSTVLYDFNPDAANDPGGSDTNLTIASPIWDATTQYPGPPADSGQFSDTVIRASFNGIRTADWHTTLVSPALGSHHIAQLLLTNGDWQCIDNSAPPCGGGSIPVANLNSLSNIFAQVLTNENPPNTIIPVILTDYITAYDSSGCCVLGYHNAQAGISNPNGILVWAWATFLPHNNDPFGAAALDMSVLSHEMTELYHDPFINNNVAPWVDGSVGFAQGNLETGDVIEAMNPSDSIYTVPLGIYTYHVQNEALLPWFTRNPMAGGLYSWPNIHTLSQCAHVLSATPHFCYGEGSGAFNFGPPY